MTEGCIGLPDIAEQTERALALVDTSATLPEMDLGATLLDRLAERIGERIQAPQAVQTPGVNPTKPKEPLSKDALNTRLEQLAMECPDLARNPSPTAWAKAIGASKSSVSATPFYILCKAKYGKTRKAKVQGLTQAHDDHLGQSDEGLFRLEAEEERERERLITQSRRDAELEPSPLDNDPPGRPRKRPRQFRS
jgi:hypothetical protein